MNPSIDGVDDDPGPIGDVIDPADANNLADQRRLTRPALEQRQGGGTPIDTGLLQGPLHIFEFVGPLTELAQLGFDLSAQHPNAGTPFLGQTQLL